MEGGGGDNFQDWEVLQSSDSESDLPLVNSPERGAAAAAVEEGIDDTDGGDYSEGMIRSDYFSLDNENRYAKTGLVVDVVSEEEGSVESDNPSWIDPGSETRYPVKNSGEFWSDSGSDRSDERKLGEFQVGLLRAGGFDGGVGSDSSGVEKGSEIDDHVKKEEGEEESEVVCGGSDENSSGGEVAVSRAVGGQDENKGRMVWWKVPFEVFKYCVLKVNPVWSFSVAAAVMGLVILGRKLYRMKRKPRSLQLKVTLDDKKVSQFRSRAARLNEAFSVVRRVPIVRPALPAAGVNSWPVMSMR